MQTNGLIQTILKKKKEIEPMQPRKKWCLVVSLVISLCIPGVLVAQEYPTKPITLIIPFGPGGGHDLLFRAVTSVAADYLGQPIIIKLMPGGGGAIGADAGAKAPPDGYTLFAGGTRPARPCRPSKAEEKVPTRWRPSAG